MNTRTVLHCLARTLFLAALATTIRAQNPPPESKPQSTDAATGSAQPAKKAKHVFTNDDFARPSNSSDSDAGVDISSQWNMESYFPKDPITAKEIEAVQKFVMPSYQFNLGQTKASVANLYLQQYKDVQFPGRDEWEERLFARFECTRSAQADYVKELDSAAKDPAYRDLLTATRFSDDELRKISDLRRRLIAGWRPVTVCNVKFDVVRKEGWQRAEEWLKLHPPKSN